MTVLHEKLGPGSCIISEAELDYSRDVVTVNSGPAGYPPNTMLGMITATKEHVIWNPSANDGSQTVSGILIFPIKGKQPATILRRHAQVLTPALHWPDGATPANKTAGIAGLASLGIIAR